MPRERDLHLDEYEISKARYRELLYKCRQYPESKPALVDLVEETARQAVAEDIGLYESLIRNVAYGTPYYQMSVPCGKNQFTKLRRRFFYLLDKNAK